MKAQKIKFEVIVEALDVNVLKNMLTQVIENVEKGIENGKLEFSDGDCVKWAVTKKEVEF